MELIWMIVLIGIYFWLDAQAANTNNEILLDNDLELEPKFQ